MARLPHDHGTAEQAIDYAVDVEGMEADTFLRAWREGKLGEWPEFYEWLDKQEADLKAWRKGERERLKGFRIGPAKRSPSDLAAQPTTAAPATDTLNPLTTDGVGKMGEGNSSSVASRSLSPKSDTLNHNHTEGVDS